MSMSGKLSACAFGDKGFCVLSIKEVAVSQKAENEKDFTDKMMTTVSNGFTCHAISLGLKLGLFESLAKYTTHKTSQEIADDKGFKERYVREWLGSMVTSRIVDLDDSGKKYFLPRHRIPALSDLEGMAYQTPLLPMIGRVEEDIFNCFKSDGPRGVPYSRYPGLQDGRKTVTVPMAHWETLKKRIAKVPGMMEKLENGCEVVDMGTGPGLIPLAIAERFPKSMVWGLDISEEGIEMGKKDAAARGLKNIKFAVQDICKMPAEWENKWDFVTMFDVAHDVPHTTKMLKEMVRVLKPGGYYLMMDIGVHTEPKDNIAVPIATFAYTISLFHCMVVSLNEEGGEGWGTAWGVEKAVELIKEAGFGEVSVSDGLLAVCHKPESA